METALTFFAWFAVGYIVGRADIAISVLLTLLVLRLLQWFLE